MQQPNRYAESAERRRQALAADLERQAGPLSGTAIVEESDSLRSEGGPASPATVGTSASIKPAMEPRLAAPVAVPEVTDEEEDVDELVRKQGVYIRPSDELLVEQATAFIRANRRHLKSRRSGLSVLFRAGLDVLVQVMERDPDMALVALRRAFPQKTS